MFRFLPVAVGAANIGLVMQHFYRLHDKHLLKHRIPEVKNVTPENALGMIMDPHNRCFVIVDSEDHYRVAAEIVLNGFQGRAAQLHHSFNPDYFGKLALQVSKDTLDQIALFNVDGTYYLDTLIGITPESNRLALRFLKLNGFETMATIPSGFYIADADRHEGAVLSLHDLNSRREN